MFYQCGQYKSLSSLVTFVRRRSFFGRHDRLVSVPGHPMDTNRVGPRLFRDKMSTPTSTRSCTDNAILPHARHHPRKVPWDVVVAAVSSVASGLAVVVVVVAVVDGGQSRSIVRNTATHRTSPWVESKVFLRVQPPLVHCVGRIVFVCRVHVVHERTKPRYPPRHSPRCIAIVA